MRISLNRTFPKGNLLTAQRLPFTLQNMAFYNVKGCESHPLF